MSRVTIPMDKWAGLYPEMEVIEDGPRGSVSKEKKMKLVLLDGTEIDLIGRNPKIEERNGQYFISFDGAPDAQ